MSASPCDSVLATPTLPHFALPTCYVHSPVSLPAKSVGLVGLARYLPYIVLWTRFIPPVHGARRTVSYPTAPAQVGSRAGARTLGSGGFSTPFVVGLSPVPIATFPTPASSNPACGFPLPVADRRTGLSCWLLAKGFSTNLQTAPTIAGRGGRFRRHSRGDLRGRAGSDTSTAHRQKPPKTHKQHPPYWGQYGRPAQET